MDPSRADAPPPVRVRPDDPPGAASPAAPAQPVAGIVNTDLPMVLQPESQRGTLPEITESPEAVTLAFRPAARAQAPHQEPRSPAAISSADHAPATVLPDKAASTDGDGSAPADARTIALRRSAPRHAPLAITPAAAPEVGESAGTTTLPVRRGLVRLSPADEALQDPPDGIADELGSFPFDLPAPPAPISAPAPAPVTESETFCPRCGGDLISPESLGLCQKCGYCRSLEESRSRKRQTAKAPANEPRMSLVEFFESLGRLPEWFWVLLCGVGCAVAVSLLGHYLLPPQPLARAWWSTTQLCVGLVAVLLGQAWALVLVAPHDDRIGAIHLLLPGRVWWLACRRLPATRWPVWLGCWGLALGLGAAILVGDLGYWFKDSKHDLASIANQLVQNRPADRSLRDAASGMDNKSEKSLLTEAKKGLESLSDLAFDLVKEKRRDDPRATTECVVIGYTQKEDGSTNGLILATVRDGALHYAGVVHHGLEDNLNLIQEKLQQLAQREEMISDTNIRAKWIKPELFVEVHSSGQNEDGTLEDPNLKGTLRAPEKE